MQCALVNSVAATEYEGDSHVPVNRKMQFFADACLRTMADYSLFISLTHVRTVSVLADELCQRRRRADAFHQSFEFTALRGTMEVAK